MTLPETRTTIVGEVARIPVRWSSVIAGAFCAAALALVLHGFAAALGLSASSAAPTWRDASFALVLLSGLYLVVAAILSYGFGGYLAGRLRPEIVSGSAEETRLRDGIHGLIVWAIATVLTALFALAALPSVVRLAAPATGPASPVGSASAESIIAYDLDRLFRGDRGGEGDSVRVRGEAGRILLTAASHRGLQPDDRAYLVRLVSARTGLSPADADGRVGDVITRAKESIDRARRSGVILGFMAAAAALLGAAAAWYGACAGGDQRDGRSSPHVFLNWADTGYPHTRVGDRGP
jgi:hypothetical protein